jgi:hypothetical protein
VQAVALAAALPLPTALLLRIIPVALVYMGVTRPVLHARRSSPTSGACISSRGRLYMTCRALGSEGQVSTGQVSTGQVSTGQVSAGQVSAGQVSAGQVGAGASSYSKTGVELSIAAHATLPPIQWCTRNHVPATAACSACGLATPVGCMYMIAGTACDLQEGMRVHWVV